jgi:DNA modification methylase
MLEINKIHLGDCRELLKEIPDNSIDLIITDPPYMISQKGKNISRKCMNSKMFKANADIKLDFGAWDNFDSEKEFFDFTETWFKECARVLKDKSWIYVCFSKEKIGYFDLLLAKKYGLKTRTIFTWVKSNPCPSFRKVNYNSGTEYIWVGSKGDCKIKNFLKQIEMNNYMITPNKSSYGVTEHPTEKPLVLFKRFIQTSSNEGEIVLDCFVGGGTTAVACKELKRNFIGIEKEKLYVDMANKRLQQEVL